MASLFTTGGSVPVCAGMLVSATHVLTSLECARMLDASTDSEGMGGTARLADETFMVQGAGGRGHGAGGRGQGPGGNPPLAG